MASRNRDRNPPQPEPRPRPNEENNFWDYSQAYTQREQRTGALAARPAPDRTAAERRRAEEAQQRAIEEARRRAQELENAKEAQLRAAREARERAQALQERAAEQRREAQEALRLQRQQEAASARQRPPKPREVEPEEDDDDDPWTSAIKVIRGESGEQGPRLRGSIWGAANRQQEEPEDEEPLGFMPADEIPPGWVLYEDGSMGPENPSVPNDIANPNMPGYVPDYIGNGSDLIYPPGGLPRPSLDKGAPSISATTPAGGTTVVGPETPLPPNADTIRPGSIQPGRDFNVLNELEMLERRLNELPDGLQQLPGNNGTKEDWLRRIEVWRRRGLTIPPEWRPRVGEIILGLDNRSQLSAAGLPSADFLEQRINQGYNDPRNQWVNEQMVKAGRQPQEAISFKDWYGNSYAAESQRLEEEALAQESEQRRAMTEEERQAEAAAGENRSPWLAFRAAFPDAANAASHFGDFLRVGLNRVFDQPMRTIVTEPLVPGGAAPGDYLGAASSAVEDALDRNVEELPWLARGPARIAAGVFGGTALALGASLGGDANFEGSSLTLQQRVEAIQQMRAEIDAMPEGREKQEARAALASSFSGQDNLQRMTQMIMQKDDIAQAYAEGARQAAANGDPLRAGILGATAARWNNMTANEIIQGNRDVVMELAVGAVADPTNLIPVGAMMDAWRLWKAGRYFGDPELVKTLQYLDEAQAALAEGIQAAGDSGLVPLMRHIPGRPVGETLDNIPLVNITQLTKGSRAAKLTRQSFRMMDMLVGRWPGITTQDAKLIINTLFTNPKQLVQGIPIDQFTTPAIQASFADGGLFKVGESVLGQKAIKEFWPALKQAQDEILAMPALQADGVLDLPAFGNAIQDIVNDSGRRLYGIVDASSATLKGVPVGATNFKVGAAKGAPGQYVIEYYTKEGQLLGNSRNFIEKGSAEATAAEMRSLANASEHSGLVRALSYPMDLTREIMNLTFLGGTGRNIIKNALNAAAGTTSNGYMNFKPVNELFDELENFFGPMLGSMRTQEAKAGTLAQGWSEVRPATGKGPRAAIQKVSRPLMRVPYGTTEVPVKLGPFKFAIPVGEQNWWTRNWHGAFMKNWRNQFGDFLQKEVVQPLIDGGVPPQLVMNTRQHLTEYGLTHTRDEFFAELRRVLAGGNTPPSLQALGIPDGVLSPRSMKLAQSAAEIYGKPSATPEELQEAQEKLRAAFALEQVRMADVFSKNVPPPGAGIGQSGEILGDTADYMDALTKAATKAGIDPASIKAAVNQFGGNQEQMLAQFVGDMQQVQLPPATAKNILSKTLQDIFEANIQYRQKHFAIMAQADQVAKQAAGNRAAVQAAWGKAFNELKVAGQELVSKKQGIIDQARIAASNPDIATAYDPTLMRSQLDTLSQRMPESVAQQVRAVPGAPQGQDTMRVLANSLTANVDRAYGVAWEAFQKSKNPLRAFDDMARAEEITRQIQNSAQVLTGRIRDNAYMPGGPTVSKAKVENTVTKIWKDAADAQEKVWRTVAEVIQPGSTKKIPPPVPVKKAAATAAATPPVSTPAQVTPPPGKRVVPPAKQAVATAAPPPAAPPPAAALPPKSNAAKAQKRASAPAGDTRPPKPKGTTATPPEGYIPYGAVTNSKYHGPIVVEGYRVWGKGSKKEPYYIFWNEDEKVWQQVAPSNIGRPITFPSETVADDATTVATAADEVQTPEQVQEIADYMKVLDEKVARLRRALEQPGLAPDLRAQVEKQLDALIVEKNARVSQELEKMMPPDWDEWQPFKPVKKITEPWTSDEIAALDDAALRNDDAIDWRIAELESLGLSTDQVYQDPILKSLIANGRKIEKYQMRVTLAESAPSPVSAPTTAEDAVAEITLPPVTQVVFAPGDKVTTADGRGATIVDVRRNPQGDVYYGVRMDDAPPGSKPKPMSAVNTGIRNSDGAISEGVRLPDSAKKSVAAEPKGVAAESETRSDIKQTPFDPNKNRPAKAPAPRSSSKKSSSAKPYTLETASEAIREAFLLSEEEGIYVRTMLDMRSRSWAKLTGNSPEDYFPFAFGSIANASNGGKARLDYLGRVSGYRPSFDKTVPSIPAELRSGISSVQRLVESFGLPEVVKGSNYTENIAVATHELGHMFALEMEALAKVSEQGKKDWEAVVNYVNSLSKSKLPSLPPSMAGWEAMASGEMNSYMFRHEAIADTLRAYLAVRGTDLVEAYPPEVRTVFERFTTWAKEILETVKFMIGFQLKHASASSLTPADMKRLNQVVDNLPDDVVEAYTRLFKVSDDSKPLAKAPTAPTAPTRAPSSSKAPSAPVDTEASLPPKIRESLEEYKKKLKAQHERFIEESETRMKAASLGEDPDAAVAAAEAKKPVAPKLVPPTEEVVMGRKALPDGTQVSFRVWDPKTRKLVGGNEGSVIGSRVTEGNQTMYTVVDAKGEEHRVGIYNVGYPVEGRRLLPSEIDFGKGYEVGTKMVSPKYGEVTIKEVGMGPDETIVYRVLSKRDGKEYSIMPTNISYVLSNSLGEPALQFPLVGAELPWHPKHPKVYAVEDDPRVTVLNSEKLLTDDDYEKAKAAYDRVSAYPQGVSSIQDGVPATVRLWRGVSRKSKKGPNGSFFNGLGSYFTGDENTAREYGEYGAINDYLVELKNPRVVTGGWSQAYNRDLRVDMEAARQWAKSIGLDYGAIYGAVPFSSDAEGELLRLYYQSKGYDSLVIKGEKYSNEAGDLHDPVVLFPQNEAFGPSMYMSPDWSGSAEDIAKLWAKRTQSSGANNGVEDAMQMGNAAGHMLDQLTRAQQAAMGNLENLRASTGAVPPSGVPPQVGLGVLNNAGRFNQDYDNMVSRAAAAADDAAEFTMLEPSNTRNIDTLLRMFMPYHYFWSRSAKNWIQRAVADPRVVNAWLAGEQQVQMAEARAQQQYGPGVMPPRGEGRFRGPWDTYYTNLVDLTLPFNSYGPNEFNDPEVATNPAERAWLTTKQWTPLGGLPMDMAVSAILDQVSPRPEGAAPRMLDFGLGDIFPQANLAALVGQIWSGQIPPTALTGNPYMQGVVNRYIATRPVPEGVDPYLWETIKEQAMDIGYQRQQGLEPLPEKFDPRATELWNEAVREAGKDTLLQQGLGMALGPSFVKIRPEELDARSLVNTRRKIGYSDENLYGSNAAVQALDEQTGGIHRAMAMYSDAYPSKTGPAEGEIDYGRPGIGAAKRQKSAEADQLYEQRDAQVEAYIKENWDTMTTSELWDGVQAIKEQTKGKVKELDAKYPSAALGPPFVLTPDYFRNYTPAEVAQYAYDEAYDAVIDQFKAQEDAKSAAADAEDWDTFNSPEMQGIDEAKTNALARALQDQATLSGYVAGIPVTVLSPEEAHELAEEMLEDDSWRTPMEQQLLKRGREESAAEDQWDAHWDAYRAQPKGEKDDYLRANPDFADYYYSRYPENGRWWEGGSDGSSRSSDGSGSSASSTQIDQWWDEYHSQPKGKKDDYLRAHPDFADYYYSRYPENGRWWEAGSGGGSASAASSDQIDQWWDEYQSQPKGKKDDYLRTHPEFADHYYSLYPENGRWWEAGGGTSQDASSSDYRYARRNRTDWPGLEDTSRKVYLPRGGGGGGGGIGPGVGPGVGSGGMAASSWRQRSSTPQINVPQYRPLGGAEMPDPMGYNMDAPYQIPGRGGEFSELDLPRFPDWESYTRQLLGNRS